MTLEELIAEAKDNPVVSVEDTPEDIPMDVEDTPAFVPEGTLAEQIERAKAAPKDGSVPSSGVTPSQISQAPSEPSPTASEKGPKLGIDDLLAEDNFSTIAAYMADRSNMTERDSSREEIRDSFVNGMRGFNVGNPIDVAMELQHLNAGEGDELDRRRQKAAAAYTLWDSLGGAFGSQNTGMQKVDAVADYAWSLIVDPVNFVTLGIGKAGAMAATKASAQGLKLLAKSAGDAVVKDAIRRGVKKEALEQVHIRASKAVMRKGFKALGGKEGAKAATKKSLVEIGGTAVADSAVAVLSDAGIQKADRVVGRQEEYNVAQGAANAALGAVGGVLAGGLVAAKGFGGLSSTGKSIAREEALLDARLDLIAEPEGAAEQIAKSVETDAEAMQQAMRGWLTPFNELVQKGTFLNEGEGLTREAADDQTMALFFRGLNLVFEKAGVPIDKLNARAGQRRTGWVYDTIMDKNFPTEWKDQIDTMFNDVVKTVDGTKPELEEFLLLGADRASSFGRGLGGYSMANRTFRKSGLLDDTPRGGSFSDEELLAAGMDVDLPNLPFGKQVTEVLGESPPANMAEKLWDGLGGVQHGFIRMLVTHPNTTLLNVVGWGNASAMESYSDVIRGTLYAGTATLKKLSGDRKGAQEYATSATHMFRLQKQKFKNLVDYESTKDEALEYLTYRPEAQKELFRYLAGGVEAKDLVTELNLAPGQKLDKNILNKGFDSLQVLYGVSAQDMLTKTQQFMYAIDKQISLEYGQSFNEFMGRSDLLDMMTDPKKGPAYMKFKEVEAKALKQALGAVFARKFGDKQKSGAINFVANGLEEIRNAPVIGALIPFGQFFNNTISFMSDHVGLSLALRPLGVTKGDPMEYLTKTVAGLSVVGWATSREIGNLEEGLAWDEERDRDGKIVSKALDFPLSAVKMAGRMGAHLIRDEEIPKDLVSTFSKTFTLEALSRSMDKAGEQLYRTMNAFANGEQGEGMPELKKAFESIAGTYISGGTRFLDPVNKALAFSEGEDYVEPSRNIGNKGLNNGIRYTDRIIDTLLEGVGLEGLESLPFDTEGYRVEKNSATNDRDLGSNPGAVVGSREVPATSYIGRMFNDIGKARWEAGLFTENPSANEVMKEFAFPILERIAKRQFDTGSWGDKDIREKQQSLAEIINIARKDIKTALQRSYKGPARQAGLIMEINNRKSSGTYALNKVLKEYEVSIETLDDLSMPQLDRLLSEIKREQKDHDTKVSRSIRE